MTQLPPRWLESLGEFLLPPASREHALGDVTEYSGSNFQYLVNLLRILPSAVWCQIRRRTGLAGVIVNALISGYTLGFCQGYFDPAGFNGSAAWLRLAVPWAIWMAGCVLAAAYGPASVPGAWNWKLFSAAIVAAAAAGALVGLSVIGLVVGLAVMLALVLVLSMPWLKPGELQQPLTIENLPQRARRFQKTIWWRNMRESSVALVLVVIKGRQAWLSQSGLDVAADLVLIAGMLFIIYYLHFRAEPRRVPEGMDIQTVRHFHRHEVARQRDILRAVPFWYLLPLLPGIVIDIAQDWRTSSDLPVMIAVAFVFIVIWRLNLWAAKFLDRQLHDIDALPEKIQ